MKLIQCWFTRLSYHHLIVLETELERIEVGRQFRQGWNTELHTQGRSFKKKLC